MKTITTAFNFILFTTFISIWFQPLTSEALTSCGTVSEKSGSVEVLRIKPSEESSANPTRIAIPVQRLPFALNCEDVVVTNQNSRAKIKFDKAMMTLSPHSRVSVQQYAQKLKGPSLLTVTFGKARTFFKSEKKDSEKSSFRVKTPSAVMGVRGTDFFVSYEPNSAETQQATIQGSVEVEQRGTGQKVLVEKGQQVKVERIPELVTETEPPPPPAENNTIAKELPAKKVIPEEPVFVSPPTTAPINVKPLVVENISPDTVEKIQAASVLAKNETAFKSKEAVELIGKPETWKVLQEEIPLKFQNLINEF